MTDAATLVRRTDCAEISSTWFRIHRVPRGIRHALGVSSCACPSSRTTSIPISFAFPFTSRHISICKVSRLRTRFNSVARSTLDVAGRPLYRRSPPQHRKLGFLFDDSGRCVAGVLSLRSVGRATNPGLLFCSWQLPPAELSWRVPRRFSGPGYFRSRHCPGHSLPLRSSPHRRCSGLAGSHQPSAAWCSRVPSPTSNGRVSAVVLYPARSVHGAPAEASPRAEVSPTTGEPVVCCTCRFP